MFHGRDTYLTERVKLIWQDRFLWPKEKVLIFNAHLRQKGWQFEEWYTLEMNMLRLKSEVGAQLHISLFRMCVTSRFLILFRKCDCKAALQREPWLWMLYFSPLSFTQKTSSHGLHVILFLIFCSLYNCAHSFDACIKNVYIKLTQVLTLKN